MEWLDFLLGTLLLAVVPFVLAAYGGHLAAQTLTDPKVRRNTKLKFWGLCLLGIVVAFLHQYRVEKSNEEREYKAAKADTEHQRKTAEAQREALKAQADLRAIERSNGAQILWLRKRLDNVIAHGQSPDQARSAREIKDELAEMAESLNRQIVPTQPTILVTPSIAQGTKLLTPTQRCDGDNLSKCSDEKLLEWGKPLVEKMDTIENAYMADLKALDEIKGTWMGFLIGKDKDSKWLKAFAEAGDKAADRFRDCCAEDALKYHRELARRAGGGLENNELYDWIQELEKPIKSKEWKEARQDGGKIVDMTGDLHLLQIRLDEKDRIARVEQASH